MANDAPYTLAAADLRGDLDAAWDAVERRIATGCCHINSTTVQDEPQMPFGGMKASGWGRFGGRAALEEFTELRWVTVQGDCVAPLSDLSVIRRGRADELERLLDIERACRPGRSPTSECRRSPRDDPGTVEDAAPDAVGRRSTSTTAPSRT